MVDWIPVTEILIHEYYNFLFVQEATQVDTELGLTPDQIQQFHQLGASTPNFLHPVLHYQLQGTWETPSGKFVNYIILKDSLESKVDISR